MTTATKDLKLNLGSRNRALEGFKSMDCDKHVGVDYVGDVSDLSRFESGSVSQIYASHILEHFPHIKTYFVLEEWCRVLKKGGILYIAVPDFQRAVELYQKTGFSAWLQNWICGDQLYTTAFHYAIFDKHRLRRLLLEAGFKEVSEVENLPFLTDDCSTLVSTIDGQSVSLNMVAVK